MTNLPVTYSNVNVSVTPFGSSTPVNYVDANVTISAFVPPPSISVNATYTLGSPITVSVANGPGNPTDWIAIANAGAPPSSYLEFVYLNGSSNPPKMGLTSATVTLPAPQHTLNYEARFFSKDSFNLLASAPFTVVASTVPHPTNIVFSPVSPTIPSNSLSGLLVSTIAVTMSDGSPFSGTLALTQPGTAFKLSGNSIQTARALTPADAGTFSLVVSATE